MRDEYGLDLADHTSKSLDEFAGQRFDWVISLCDRVREVCPEFPGHPEVIHWSIANPATHDPDDVTYPLFQQVAAAGNRRASSSCSRCSPIGHPLPETQGEAHDRPQ